MALSEDINDIDKMLKESPDEDGTVVGDEMRLRQVITNLARSVILSAKACFRLIHISKVTHANSRLLVAS